MINIIPEERKKIIEKERIRRFVLVLGISLFSLSIFLIILSIPSVVYLSGEEREIKRTIGALESGPIFKEIRNIEKEIQELSKKLILFQNNQDNVLSPSFFVEKILEQKPGSLKIETMSFNKLNKIPKITIRGRSPSRLELLKFIGDLSGTPSIKNVYSPIANILREKDVEFNLVVEFK